MGRNSQLMEACLLYSRTAKPVTDMQDFSQKNAQTAMVHLQNDLPMEGIQQKNADMQCKTTSSSSSSVNRICARHEAVDRVARFKSKVADVVFEDSVPHSQTSSQYESSHLSGEFFQSKVISANDVQGSQCAKPCTQNSTTSIPLVPDIIIEHVPSSSAALGHCQASAFSTALHSSLAIGPSSQGQKKCRTHSDSSIYEADKRISCVRSSLSSLQSLFVEPSDVLAHRTVANTDPSNPRATHDEVSPAVRKDDCDTFVEPESPNCSRRCRKLALPSALNFSGIDHFTAAQEKSPKTYWLRRHSDSNVADEHEKGLHAEHPHTLRSHSASDTIPEIKSDEGMEAEHIGEEVTTDKCFLLESSRTQSASSDRKKCQKVKKYLQTRYQNQSLDMDDVFMDCSTETDISRPPPPGQWPLADEDAPAAAQIVYLPQPLSINSEDTVSCSANKSKTTTGPPSDKVLRTTAGSSSDKVQTKKLLCINDDSANVFENSSPSYSLSSPRQSVFQFPFSSPYSVLGDLPVNSGNIFFSLFPQGCLPGSYLPSPLTLESFTMESPSSNGALASPLLASQDRVTSSPGESKCWQSTVWSATASPKKVLKEADNELIARAGGSDHELNRRGFLERQESLCSTTNASLESSSNKNQTSVKTVKSNDKLQSIVVSHEYPLDSSAASSPSAIISPSKPLLHTLSSPLPSSPVVSTPTRASPPQVVFNYQFSERIHEQRQTGDNFVCPVCGSLFLSYNSLANHVVSHLPSEVITQEGSGDSSKVHLCKVCNRSFSRSDMLSRHMRLHTGLRPYECHLCRQVFSRSDHLHTHLRTHTGEKPYRCSHCMYAAPRRDMVTRHMRIHMRGSTRRGRRSSSTSSLANDSYQTSSHVATDEQSTGGQTPKTKAPRTERRKAGSSSLHKQRNWSVTSSENNDGPDGFDDKDLTKMTRTDSTTSVDSGVSYLTPRSLAPSLWSPGIDSPDVFSRHPGGHFLWPSPELKHELDKGSLAYTTKDMDFEMHASFQKCKVTSPAAQTSSQPTDELVEGQ